MTILRAFSVLAIALSACGGRLPTGADMIDYCHITCTRGGMNVKIATPEGHCECTTLKCEAPK